MKILIVLLLSVAINGRVYNPYIKKDEFHLDFEGVVRCRGKPVTDATVSYVDQYKYLRDTYLVNVRTDSNGHYSVDRIVTGGIRIAGFDFKLPLNIVIVISHHCHIPWPKDCPHIHLGSFEQRIPLARNNVTGLWETDFELKEATCEDGKPKGQFMDRYKGWYPKW